jgi:hypothetical protein
VTKHRFKIGQLVHFYPRGAGRMDSAPGQYQITKRLPAGEMASFGTRSGTRWKSTTASQVRESWRVCEHHSLLPTVGNVLVGNRIKAMRALKKNPKALYASLGFN